jgi:hypothetical protein
MNQRETNPAPVIGAGQALPCLALLLLPLLAVTNARARLHFPGKASTGQSGGPYLPRLGSPELRFQELTPRPILIARLAAVVPPIATEPSREPTADSSVSPSPTLSTSPSDSDPAATTTAALTPPDAADDQASPIASANDQPAAELPASRPAEPARESLPILHDDLRPSTRPEDFLPYFQLPVAGGVNVIAPVPAVSPAPGTLPPSSATYTQTPR